MSEFPIKTATSCQLKWAWSTIFLNRGETSSCHRVNGISLTPENFKNFHNMPKKLQDRTDMINGVRPVGGCEYCFKIEDAGGISDRLHSFETLNNLTPKEFLTETNPIQVTPTILEVYFTNVCNLSCVYCGPWFSSVWENEYKKFGPIDIGNGKYSKGHNWKFNTNYKEMSNQLWEWMRENSKHLRKFQILGGEPFFQPEFEDVLNHFDQYPNHECDFVIITNLMVNDTKFDYYIERLKKLVAKRKLKSLQITASLDCWGKQAEYIRYGLDLNQWERNFNKLVDIKFIRLQINFAITALSIKYMLDLIKKINEWNKKHKIYISFMSVNDPTFMNPDIFDAELFKQDFKEILEIFPKDSHYEASAYSYLN